VRGSEAIGTQNIAVSVIELISIIFRPPAQGDHLPVAQPPATSPVTSSEVVLMRIRIRHVLLLGISVSLLAALPAWAYQSGGGGQRGGQSAPLNQPSPDLVYGSQLMTPAERGSYRNQMRSLKTAQERETLRKQHHEQMQKRATERGVTLPDMPPRRGAGMGPGTGMGRGAGMGPGTGMGPGAGMQQRTQQQIKQQQKDPGQDQETKQKQRTEQQTQASKQDGNS
jgi:hypothetical protein